jgi:hypothetical protein
LIFADFKDREEELLAAMKASGVGWALVAGSYAGTTPRPFLHWSSGSPIYSLRPVFIRIQQEQAEEPDEATLGSSCPTIRRW